MADPSEPREQEAEQPQPEPQPVGLRRRRRRITVALVSLGVVIVAGVVITVAAVKHGDDAVSNDPGCKEYSSQLTGFLTTPPTGYTDYEDYAKYYGAYYFPAAYAVDHAQNDQVTKAMIALRDASQAVESDATKDDVVGGGTPVSQSTLQADISTFDGDRAAVDQICALN